MTPPRWGHGRHLLRLGIGDELLVAHRIVIDRKLEQSVEHEPPTVRAAAVEAEDELVDSFELVTRSPAEPTCSVCRT